MWRFPRRIGIVIVLIVICVILSWLVAVDPLINASNASSRLPLSQHTTPVLSLSPTAPSSLVIATTPTVKPTPTAMLTPTAAARPILTIEPTSPPYTPNSYEAESSMNVLTGSAGVYPCTKCSQGKYVAYIGKGSTGNANDNGTLLFNVTISSAGTHPLIIYYVNKDPQRIVLISINGGQGISVTLPQTSNTWGIDSTVNSMSVNVTLNQGHNTIKFYNDVIAAPNFDRIVV